MVAGMASIDNTTRAREYLRVSVDKSGRQRSPEEQHTDNQRAADARNWVLGKEYRDKGSASRYASKAREGFDKLLADLERDRFGAQVLVLWESSRGSRQVDEWVKLIRLCETRGVQIFVTSDGKLYDPGDPRDRRTLIEDANDAEYESAKTSKRTRRSTAAAAAAGRPHGRIPFGYRRIYSATTGRLERQEPEPAEAKVIRELFDRLHKGHSLRSIERDFEQRGILTRQRYDKETKKPLPREPFSAQHLRSLAITRTYMGERVHDPKRRSGTLSAGAVFIPADWPALVPRAKFLAVQRLLTAPERKTTRPGRAVHLASMIVRCDVCGGPLCAAKAGQSYACRAGGHVTLPYPELNTFVEQVVLAYLSRKDHAARLTAGDGEGEQLAAVRAEVAAIRVELDELADQLGRGEVTATLAARAEPAIIKRLKDAEQREQELSTPSVLRGLITPGRDVARRWRAAPMSAKRAVARIVLSPNVLGELRVARSAVRNNQTPVADRVIFRRAEA